MDETNIFRVKRSYKDTLFRMIFIEKDKLLSLYNAVSGNHYTDPEALEIVTLKNAIYMNMKNDLAFVIDCSLNLYEHQSTYSPNMPIRNLFYIARELEKMLNHRSLYSTKPVLFPEPCFIVFFNGTDQPWSQKTLKLSDCYQKKTDNPKLELLVTMLNINLGRNDDLLEKCPALLEYMQYVDKVRTYSATMNINQAVEQAVNECIHEGILAEFLLRSKSEAIQMSIFEYDEEKELKLIKQDEREMGREEGLLKGIQFCILDNLSQHVPFEEIIKKLQNGFQLTTQEAENLVKKYTSSVQL